MNYYSVQLFRNRNPPKFREFTRKIYVLAEDAVNAERMALKECATREWVWHTVVIGKNVKSKGK